MSQSSLLWGGGGALAVFTAAETPASLLVGADVMLSNNTGNGRGDAMLLWSMVGDSLCDADRAACQARPPAASAQVHVPTENIAPWHYNSQVWGAHPLSRQEALVLVCRDLRAHARFAC